jgi:hypothetical protein
MSERILSGKLGQSFHKNPLGRRKYRPTYEINLTDNPSSCILNIGKNRLRALINTRALVSLISKKMFDSLPFRPQVNRKDIPFLQATNSLTSIGSIEMTFKISRLDMTQKFYVTDGLNCIMILGRDWMTKYKVCLYFDLGLISGGFREGPRRPRPPSFLPEIYHQMLVKP